MDLAGLTMTEFGVAGAFGLALSSAALAFVAGRHLGRRTAEKPSSPAAGTRAALCARLETMLRERQATACLAIEIDTYDDVLSRIGRPGTTSLEMHILNALQGLLRHRDMIHGDGNGQFTLLLGPAPRINLESVIQIATRLRDAAQQPLSIDAASVHASVSIGFCLTSRAPLQTADAVIDAAGIALAEARRHGPGAIRSYTAELAERALSPATVGDEVERALLDGDIVAHFQPQISTDTGEVSGIEALARWRHPVKGLLMPAEFLPALRAGGLSEALSEAMLRHALKALTQWDSAGLDLPGIAVNFTQEDLRNPELVGRLKWELDRFDITPDRLTIEVLESVLVASDDDVVVRNIAALSTLGCRIDLDDFGTGNASIAAMRRFAIDRIKIDRSFITRLDRDPAQQRIVTAILAMADQLGLKAVGEGVESLAEHALLAQLGCSDVQGYAIARPMEAAILPDWLIQHRAKLKNAPGLAFRT